MSLSHTLPNTAKGRGTNSISVTLIDPFVQHSANALVI